MPGRPWMLEESTWKTVATANYEVAVLPWGATEAHNTHLPYGTDIQEAEHVAAESARIAWEQGARVTVLPAIPFGVNTGQLDIPLCINMNPSTQAMVLRDVADSLSGQGIRKLVIVNGHGGNDFRTMIRELQPSGMFISAVNWWTVARGVEFFDEPGDHAGELETSVMLEIAGELVLPLSEAGEGKARRFSIEGLRDGTAWAPRQWTSVTDDTGVGNPARATREKGRAFIAEVSRRVGSFLVDLARAPLDRLYE